MTEPLSLMAVALLVAIAVMLVFVLRRSPGQGPSAIITRLDTMEMSSERSERDVKEEFVRNRQEAAEQGRGLRGEVQAALKTSTDSLVHSVDRISETQQQRLEDFANQLNLLKQAGDASGSQLRLELTGALNGIRTPRTNDFPRMPRNFNSILSRSVSASWNSVARTRKGQPRRALNCPLRPRTSKNRSKNR